jgi:hypothetical protein
LIRAAEPRAERAFCAGVRAVGAGAEAHADGAMKRATDSAVREPHANLIGRPMREGYDALAQTKAIRE